MNMNWLYNIFFSNSIAHSLLLLAMTITIGIVMSKIRVKGISFGIAWILFTGICLSHFGMTLDPVVETFVKEFGLILFVYSIGLQVGPGFFASLRQGGLTLNMLATSIVLLGCVVTYVIHVISGVDLNTMVGVLSGAVTNTPGLGAAQQTFVDTTGGDADSIAMGYAVAYPLGVIGIILSMIFLRGVFSRKLSGIEALNENAKKNKVKCVDIKVHNNAINGYTINKITKLINREFVVSRIIRSSSDSEVAVESSIVNQGDILRIVTNPDSVEAITAFLGERVYIDVNHEQKEISDLVLKRIVVTKEAVHGRKIGELNIRALYDVNITRINRAGVDLVAVYDLRLQMGDRVTVVGTEESIAKVTDMLGNSMKRLDHPNLLPIFFGIFLGVLFGSIPFVIPGIPQPIKLGLAGGPLIIAILISRYGPYYKVVTFTTTSANMMLREIGISIFLASVGLGAGEQFVQTILEGGYWWVLYGIAITIIPLLIVGTIAVWRYKLDGNTLMGLLAGSTTDPPALAYANGVSVNDKASVAYATVYPLTMFLRVLTAQILILIACS
ncbi:MAG: putative transporter [Rikenellaceae bacterium]